MNEHSALYTWIWNTLCIFYHLLVPPALVVFYILRETFDSLLLEPMVLGWQMTSRKSNSVATKINKKIHIWCFLDKIPFWQIVRATNRYGTFANSWRGTHGVERYRYLCHHLMNPTCLILLLVKFYVPRIRRIVSFGTGIAFLSPA